MSPELIEGRVFTTYCPGIARVLENEVVICAAHDPDNPPADLKQCEFLAIWDTGATNTVISSRVARECGLHPIGMTQVAGVHGVEHCKTHLVNVILRNNVGVSAVQVTEVDALSGKADVLIGMDLISLGDFAVSTYQDRTVFTFRTPSAGHINFIPPSQRPRLPAVPGVMSLAFAGKKVGRNDQCPCGSGRKFKRCCGANT